MKELNYRFKSLEEKIINKKEVHKAEDIFENNIVFIEKFKEIQDMDWDESSKVEEELNNLKNNKQIIDFFYNNDYERDLKIFYKVYKDYPEFNIINKNKEKTHTKKEVNKSSDATMQHKGEFNIRPTNEEEEKIKKLEEEAEKYEKEAQKVLEEYNRKIEENNKEKDEEIIKVNTKKQIRRTEKKLESSKKEDKTYKLNELGGSVKINITNDKTNTNSTNITADNNPNTTLELDYKKTVSRAEMNNKIICKVCEQPLKKERLDLENNIGYCENCHAIRNIKTLNAEERAKKAIKLVSPKGMTVKDSGSKLSIITDLNVKEGFGKFFTSIILLGIGLTSMEEGANFSIIIFMFSIFLFYIGLIDVFNKIYIDVTKQSLIIKSSPLPHFPMKTFQSNRISQIYVKEYVTQNKGHTYRSYKVRAILKNGKDKVLVKLDNPEYALYLERSIESWLGIEDRYIKGEYK